jgi:hypothetical protein
MTMRALASEVLQQVRTVTVHAVYLSELFFETVIMLIKLCALRLCMVLFKKNTTCLHAYIIYL